MSVVGRVVFLMGRVVFLMWGELSWGNFLWGELSWGELSLERVAHNPFSHTIVLSHVGQILSCPTRYAHALQVVNLGSIEGVFEFYK